MISLDTETTGLDLYHGAMPFLVTTFDGADHAYWEWDVDPLTRKPLVPHRDKREIRDLVNSEDLLILQNPKFDLKGLAVLLGLTKEEIKGFWGKTRDTLLAGHLLASNSPHDLTTMGITYLGVDIKKYEDRLERAVKEARNLVRSGGKDEQYAGWKIAKKDAEDMPSAKDKTWKYDMWLPRAIAKANDYFEDHDWWTLCSDYANADSEITFPLYERQVELIKEQGLWQIYLERLKILPVLSEMEERGVTMSRPRLLQQRKEYHQESARHGRICTNIARGYNYELTLPKSGNNKSLVNFVFGKEGLGLPPVKKSEKTGEPSLDSKEVIPYFQSTLPSGTKPAVFFDSLRKKRRCDTVLSYLESYERFWLPHRGEDWYRVHPSVNPTGTDTLRFSSSNPNEQNISKQEGYNTRYCFGPAPGREWWSLDYDNLELRIPAYESGEEIMIEIFEKPDDPPYFGSYHLMNASIVYPELFWPLADKKGEFKKRYASTYYQWIKNFGFAIGYGAMPQSGTADRAAHKVGAQLMVMNRLKEHSKLNQKYIGLANRHGYVETLPDKEIDPERGYPLFCTRSNWGKILPTIPLNYHVQGSACWIMMRAMIKLQPYLESLGNAYLAMNVHDEVVVDFPFSPNRGNLPKLQRVRQIMEGVGELVGVPLTCGLTYHPSNWSIGESQ